MPPTKIVSIVGARPQFIKAAVVSRVLRATDGFCEVMVHTGQHYDENLSNVFFSELGLSTPTYNCGVGSGTHGFQTGQMIEKIEAILLKELPSWVLVYGDTNSTIAGALAAAKLHIPIAHIEAGLRSFNKAMPEEVNRVLTDHISDLLFTPTDASRQNLAREGIVGDKVKVVGDVMFDASRLYSEKAVRKSKVLQQLDLRSGGYIVATVHRAENTDCIDNLSAIFRALNSFADGLRVIMPIHPRTKNILLQHEHLLSTVSQVELIEAIGYLDMMMLLKSARLIVTDSGGLQKEAFFFSVPCVTVRAETEWTELLALGWNRLAPPGNVAEIEHAIRGALVHVPEVSTNPYGDGHAADKIVDEFVHWKSKSRNTKTSKRIKTISSKHHTALVEQDVVIEIANPEL